MGLLRTLSVSGLSIAALCTASQAQVLTSRQSTVNHNYVYGAGGDTNVGSGNVIDPSLLATDTEHIDFTGSTSGFLPGEQPYAAAVECSIDHTYAISGPLPQFTSITASASTHVRGSFSGLGAALMNSNNPGNEIFFYFTLEGSTNYNLVGNVITPRPSAFTFVALQRFDGIVWQYVFYSAFLPGEQGPFNESGNLSGGNYRLWSEITLNAGGNDDLTATLDYRFSVPSPAAAGLLGLAALASSRRRRA